MKSASIWDEPASAAFDLLRIRLVLTDTQPDGTAGGGCWYRRALEK
ncbi:MAG: hypothetical protein ACLSAH_18735 [Bilophila wadsworthia]